jgi:transcriptional regulator with XRE-family HTH domain
MSAQKIHEGRNVKRIREILQVKQEVLADSLGISQQSVSLLEQRETIDAETLEQISKTLNVPTDAIKNFDENAAVNYINTFHDNSVNHGPFTANNFNCTFNPIDKIIELYEALLQSEREKVKMIERMMEKK